MNRVSSAGRAIGERAQIFPIGAVLVANLVWGIGPSLTLAVDMSINATIFYRVLLWPFILLAIVLFRKAPLNFETLKVSVIPRNVLWSLNDFWLRLIPYNFNC